MNTAATVTNGSAANMPQEIGSTPSRQHDKAGQLTGKQHHVDAQRFAQNSPHASLRRMVVSLIFRFGVRNKS
jgi:hypothetical protein